MVGFVLERSRLFVGGPDVDEVWWWWWAVGGWWWWLLLVAVAWWRGRVVGCRKRRRRTTTDVVVRRLVATSYLVGVKKEAGGSLCLLTWAGHDLLTVLACRRPGVRAAAGDVAL